MDYEFVEFEKIFKKHFSRKKLKRLLQIQRMENKITLKIFILIAKKLRKSFKKISRDIGDQS